MIRESMKSKKSGEPMSLEMAALVIGQRWRRIAKEKKVLKNNWCNGHETPKPDVELNDI